MREKYNYSSDLYYIAVFVFGVSFFGVFGGLKSDFSEIAIVYLWLLIFSLAGMFILNYIPAWFEAGKDSVSFRSILRPRCKIINYSSIRSIEVTHELRRPKTRFGSDYYEEIITFYCEDDEHIFRRRMEEPAYGNTREIASDPVKLYDYFSQGQFSRLRDYINSKLYM